MNDFFANAHFTLPPCGTDSSTPFPHPLAPILRSFGEGDVVVRPDRSVWMGSRKVRASRRRRTAALPR